LLPLWLKLRVNAAVRSEWSRDGFLCPFIEGEADTNIAVR
jgi:hypothetical protein